MKQATFAIGLIAVGLALGLVMPQVFAQAPQPEVQKWEQFCEVQEGKRGTARAIEAANPKIASHGKNGYQLVSIGGTGGVVALCYRRPAQ